MILKGKNAIIFGGSGAVGGETAYVFAREGAKVFIGARTPARLAGVVDRLGAAGHRVHSFQVDTLDATRTQLQVEKLYTDAGTIDIVVNATAFMHDQGKLLEELSLDEFEEAIGPVIAAQFNIAKACAPFMGSGRGGAFINIAAPAATMAVPGHLGHIVGCAAVEAFTRALGSELGARNIRTLCVRSHAISDAMDAGSYTHALFEPKATAAGLTVNQWLEGAAEGTMLKRLPTLSHVAETIAFLASDHAASMTAAVVNVTAGLTIN